MDALTKESRHTYKQIAALYARVGCKETSCIGLRRGETFVFTMFFSFLLGNSYNPRNYPLTISLASGFQARFNVVI